MLEFLGEVFISTIMFAIIALAALGIDKLVEWCRELQIDGFSLDVLRFTSHGIMAIDALTYVCFFIISAFRFIKGFYKQGE